MTLEDKQGIWRPLMHFNGQQITPNYPFPWTKVHQRGEDLLPPHWALSSTILPNFIARDIAGDIAYKKSWGQTQKQ